MLNQHLRSPRTATSQAVATPAARIAAPSNPGQGTNSTPLRGVAGKIAENMAISLIDPDRDLAASRAGACVG